MKTRVDVFYEGYLETTGNPLPELTVSLGAPNLRILINNAVPPFSQI